jgi:hypothetical protein
MDQARWYQEGKEEHPMTDQRPVTPAPAPLEAYTQQFDGLFAKLNQRNSFRRYLEGLLLPTERHKSLTGLANTEPVVGAQHRQAQALQWFLSESNWSERAVQARRLQLLLSDPLTAPSSLTHLLRSAKRSTTRSLVAETVSI